MQYSDDARSRIAGEYVLGLASRPLARAVRRRMRRDPALAAEVARWELALHDLGDAVAVSLPAGDRLWARIAEELDMAPTLAGSAARGAPAAAPVPATGVADAAVPPAPAVPVGRPQSGSREAHRGPLAEARRWWQSLWLWQGWAVAASALVVVLGLQDQVPAPLGAPGGTDMQAPPAMVGAPAAPSSPAAAPVVPVGDAVLAPPAAGADEPLVAGTADATGSRPAADAAAAANAGVVATNRSTAELAAESGAATVTTGQVADDIAAARPARTRGTTRGGSLDVGGAPAGAGAGPVMLGMLAATGEGNGAAFVVLRDPASGALRVRATASQSPGADRDFELWAVPKEGAPRSLGLVSGSSDTILNLDERLDRSVLGAQVLAISVEPRGGSPTGGPTGEVRFAGPMQAI